MDWFIPGYFACLFNIDLVKGDDGHFTGTTQPLDPGCHSYQLTSDGVDGRK